MKLKPFIYVVVVEFEGFRWNKVNQNYEIAPSTETKTYWPKADGSYNSSMKDYLRVWQSTNNKVTIVKYFPEKDNGES